MDHAAAAEETAAVQAAAAHRSQRGAVGRNAQHQVQMVVNTGTGHNDGLDVFCDGF